MNITHTIYGINTTPFRVADTQRTQNAELGTQTSSFAAILSQALGVEQVVGTDYLDKLSGVQTVAGDDVDIHSVVIDAQKAEIALNLTLQIRNKLVESYQEIMRMQI